MQAVERTREFRGRYHVLGGALSPIDGVDPEDLRISELVARLDEDGVTELVIATNPTMSGEATALYLADLVRGRVRVTRLASGLPVVLEEPCNGCDLCVQVCPYRAIELVEKLAVIDLAACARCGLCVTRCRRGAIEWVPEVPVV